MRINQLILAVPAVGVLAVCARANETQTENANTGTTAWQLTNPALNREIEGYASLTSVNVGGSISFFVSSSDTLYTMDFYRIGWYGGAGGREVLGPISRQGGLQPTPSVNAYGTFECNWTNPYVLNVSAAWTSGVYLEPWSGRSSLCFGSNSEISCGWIERAIPDQMLLAGAATHEEHTSRIGSVQRLNSDFVSCTATTFFLLRLTERR